MCAITGTPASGPARGGRVAAQRDHRGQAGSTEAAEVDEVDDVAERVHSVSPPAVWPATVEALPSISQRVLCC